MVGKTRGWRGYAAGLCLGLLSALQAAQGRAADTWVPPPEYLAEAGLTSAAELDDATKGNIRPRIIQLLGSDPQRLSASGLAADATSNDLVGSFLRRWSAQARMGRPAGDICLAAVRFRNTLPTEQALIENLRAAAIGGRVPFAIGETAVSGLDLSLRMTSYTTPGALAEATNVPQAIRDAGRQIAAYAAELEVYTPVFDAIVTSCGTGTFHLNDAVMDDQGLTHCEGDVGSDFDRLAPTIETDLVTALAAAGVGSFEINCARLRLSLSGVRLDRLMLANVEADQLRLFNSSVGLLALSSVYSDNRIAMVSSTVSQGLILYDVRTPEFDMSYAHIMGTAEINRLLISKSRDTPTTLAAEPGVSLSFDYAVLDQSMRINRSIVQGDINLASMRAGTFRLTDVSAGRGIFLNGSQFSGTLEIGSGNAGGVTSAGSIIGDDVTGTDLLVSNVLAGRSLAFERARFSGPLTMRNIIAGSNIWLQSASAAWLDLQTASTPVVQVAWTTFEGSLQVSGVRTNRLAASSTAAGYITINSLEGGPLTATPPRRCVDTDSAPEVTPIRQGSGPSPEQLEAAQITTGTGGCIGRAALDDSRIATRLGLEGDVLGAVDLTDATIGGLLTLATVNTRFGAASCVTGQGLRVDTLLVDPPGLVPSAKRYRTPGLIDLYGASFRVVRTSETISAKSRTDTADAFLDTLIQRVPARCNEDSGRVLTSIPWLPKGTFPAAGEPRTRPAYEPAIYDALAAGFDNTGEVDLSRAVKIEKNRAYAASIDWSGSLPGFTTKVVYTLADVISGYGYDNVRAVLLLLLITAIGAVIGILGEERIRYGSQLAWWWLRRTLRLPQKRPRPQLLTGRGRAVRSPRRRTVGVAVPSTAGDGETGLRHHIFFSLDRSIPSLGLDADFSRHRELHLGTYISVYFYLQRVLSFLILVLMIAGAFEVFQ